MKNIFLTFVSLFFLFFCGCSHLPVLPLRSTLPIQMVRVAVLRDAKDFTLETKSPAAIMDLLSAQELSRKHRINTQTVSPLEQGIQIGEEFYFNDHIKILPQRDASIFVNGRSFRGEIDIIKDDKGRLLVVNVVELEHYIKGVLYHEISDRWPMEAIKAQAVAARSYVLSVKARTRNPFFDVTNDVYSQVYGGHTSERYRTNIGVERTRGEILSYEGRILPTYYHATCAGHTEDIREIWGDGPLPLQGVACHFCSLSPHYVWKRNLRLKDIQDQLNAKGYPIGLIQSIHVLERNPSGRIRTLEIIDRSNKHIVISGKDFRSILGPNVIKSNNYEIDMKGYYVDLLGKGWGHGVGLCQWGVYFMSRQGYDYESILKYYYPGSQLMRHDQVQWR